MSGIAVAKSFRKEQLLYDQFAPVNGKRPPNPTLPSLK